MEQLSNNFIMSVGLVYLLLFVIELFLLFLLSQKITSILSVLFFHVTKSQRGSILLLAFLFLPGVIIHELAHFLMARLLFVHAEHMEFIPRVTDNHVKLGSVQIAQTDPIRRFFIGVAPLLIGLAILSSMFLFYFSPVISLPIVWKQIIVMILSFEIGNTMFSSRRDLEGSLFFLLLLFIVLVVCLLFFQPVLVFFFHMLTRMAPSMKTSDSMLAIVVGIDVVLYGSIYSALKNFKR